MTLVSQPHIEGLSPLPDTRRLTLLPDQLEARNRIVELWREGVQSIMISAPTGSGKTVLASELMRSAYEAGSRAVFIADQLQLVDQAVNTFTRYGLPLGVTQAGRYGNAMQLVVASAQTLRIEARRPSYDPDLIIVDEAHVQHKAVLDWAASTGARLLGLSATPLSTGLADRYQRVVNVTTTNRLVEAGRLVPMRIFAPDTQIDHAGVRRNRAGQYDASELAQRTTAVRGNVVAEWVEKKNELFGPFARVPTAVFTNTVEDGAAYAAEFQRAGYDFRQTTYRAKDREVRSEVLRLFEDQQIDGVISCQALAKGWDSSIVLCIIDLQSNGASVAPVIQKYGRGMRIHADIDADGQITHKPVNAEIDRKEFFFLMDHVSNVDGWAGEIVDLYSDGVVNLKQAKQQYSGKRADTPPGGDVACRGCGYLLPAGLRSCPACGRERAMPKPRHQHADATPLSERKLSGYARRDQEEADDLRQAVREEFGDRPRVLWMMICDFTANRARAARDTDRERAWMRNQQKQRGFAAAQYKNLTGQWPPRRWPFGSADIACDEVVELAIRAQLKSYALRQAKR